MVSIYRLLITIDGLAFVLTNVTYMMIYLIFEINDKKMGDYKIKWINLAFIVIALVVFLSWSINVHRLPNYLNEILPILANWIKTMIL